MLIPVVITVYADRSFSLLQRPRCSITKEDIKLKIRFCCTNKTKVATISKADLQKIAEIKMQT